jgi:integrase
MRVLTDSPQEKLIPSGLDQSKQGKYFSILRSFYRYNSNEKLPVTLNYKQKKELLQRHLLMPKDIEEIINFVIDKTRETIQDPETKISVTDYLIVFFLICIFTGLRRKEILQLKLCDIDITDRITVSVIGKMDKRRSTEINRDLVNIPEFIIKYLRFFYLQRKNETNGDFSSPVFIGKIFTDTSNLNLVSLDTTAQKIHRLIEDDNHYNGLHGLRRYFANQLRAQKVSLLNIILSLGQSTTSTAPENYLQIFPILQREQFYDWTEKQNYLTFPNEIAIFNFSRNQNTSVEGIYKILNKTNNKNKYNARPKKITINDAIALLAHRIKEIQKNK